MLAKTFAARFTTTRFAKTFLIIATLITTLAIALPGFSQVGHPAKGSWSGDLEHGVEADRIRLHVKAHDDQLTVTINPGRRGVEATSVTLDAPNWGLVIEADMPDGKLVLDGTLSNLGSWTNRKYIGTYTLGDEQGQFTITLN